MVTWVLFIHNWEREREREGERDVNHALQRRMISISNNIGQPKIHSIFASKLLKYICQTVSLKV